MAATSFDGGGVAVAVDDAVAVGGLVAVAPGGVVAVAVGAGSGVKVAGRAAVDFLQHKIVKGVDAGCIDAETQARVVHRAAEAAGGGFIAVGLPAGVEADAF